MDSQDVARAWDPAYWIEAAKAYFLRTQFSPVQIAKLGPDLTLQPRRTT
jgi:phenylalanyl-tRNA synthetase alpha subunit